MSDVEDRVRRNLRAAGNGVQIRDLDRFNCPAYRRVMAQRPQPRRRPVLVAVAAAVAVVVVVLATSIAAGGTSTEPAVPSVVGTWHLVSASSGGGEDAVTGHVPTVTFAENGTLAINDTVNYLTAGFVVADDGSLTTRFQSTTYRAGGGSTVAAVDSLVFDIQPDGTSAPSVHCTFVVSDDRLVVTTPKAVLTFTASGR